MIASMKREIYQKLVAWKQQKNRNPLILNGVRQCGKTFVLTEFGENEFAHVHYFNFERQPELADIFAGNLNPNTILEQLSFKTNKPINTTTDIVIFDEIQAIPRALTSLKYFQEELPELALCSAGSLLEIYLNDNSYPVGKVNLLKLCPMNFIEFLLAIDDKPSVDLIQNCTQNTIIPDFVHAHLWQRLKWYFVTGGLPKVVDIFRDNRENLFDAFGLVRAKQLELVSNYYGDMAKHAGKTNAMHLNRVWQSIPSQLANTQDGSAQRFKFKGVVPGVDRYSRLTDAFDWLQATGLFIRVPIISSGEQPLSAFKKEESFFKAYMFDVGILGAMSGLAPRTILDYDYGTYKGYFAKNFVAQEFATHANRDVFSWQHKRAELEFVIDVNGDVLPIEVKSGSVTRSQSLLNFSQRYPHAYRTVMSARNLNIDYEHQYHQYPLYLAGQFPLSE